jgi:hypothetical protein
MAARSSPLIASRRSPGSIRPAAGPLGSIPETNHPSRLAWTVHPGAFAMPNTRIVTERAIAKIATYTGHRASTIQKNAGRRAPDTGPILIRSRLGRAMCF